MTVPHFLPPGAPEPPPHGYGQPPGYSPVPTYPPPLGPPPAGPSPAGPPPHGPQPARGPAHGQTHPQAPAPSWPPAPPTPAGHAAATALRGAAVYPVQRPAVIAMAASMTVTASLLWICGLATAWLLAVAAQQGLSADRTFDGVMLLRLNHFANRLLDGLAVPLFGWPLLAAVAGFLVIVRRSWGRIVLTAVAAGALAWSAWWLRDGLVWWVASAGYIAVATALVWTPAVTRWYRRRPG